MMSLNENLFITGTMLNYYFTCHRELWYFAHQINMESNSELVELGKILHEDSYQREKKEIEIGPIKIDFFDNEGIIHEIKKSPKMEKAHIWQLKYYIYYLRNLGIDNLIGELDYPKLRKKKTVYLSDKDIDDLENHIIKIKAIIINDNIPKQINKSFCEQCSYYELCYIE